MRVYVVRHGESETNKIHYMTGWLDVSLTEKGREDALFARSVLEGVEFDKIYSSDLVRALQTAQIAIPGCVCERTPLIREMNVGDIAGKPIKSMSAEDRRLVPEKGYSHMGGESYEQFESRVREFMTMLESLDCNNVAVFSHAGCLKRMLNLVMGIKLPAPQVMCGNCTVAIFDYSDGIWRLHSWINAR